MTFHFYLLLDGKCHFTVVFLLVIFNTDLGDAVYVLSREFTLNSVSDIRGLRVVAAVDRGARMCVPVFINLIIIEGTTSDIL